jgi:outer membrane receptor for ferrienterochelin and colicins
MRKALALLLPICISPLLDAHASSADGPSDVPSEELLFIEIPSVVTASKTEEKICDAPGLITVVSQDELARFGWTTLKDILEHVPSLIGSTVYMTDRSIIAIRGAQFKENNVHVLLLVNGRPIREGLEGGIVSETLESFPVSIIERIEVIKGPGSVLYGSGAFAGVVNVITENASTNTAAVTGLVGRDGAVTTLAKAALTTGDVSIALAGQYHQKPDWETPYDYTVTDSVGQVSVVHNSATIPNKGPGLFLDAKYRHLRLMSSYTQWENAFFIPDFQAFGDAKWEKTFADLGYGLSVHPKWNMDFNVTYTRSLFNVASFPNVDRDSYVLTGEWANFINPIERYGIVLGGSYNYIKGEELFTAVTPPARISHGDQRSLGLYTQMDYWLSPEKVKAIAGVQVNKVENIDWDAVPRAGIIFHPLTHVNVKALYSQAFRAPSINETGLNHPALQGNPDLESEKVDTYDLGVNYDKEMIQCGVSYFYSKLTAIIRTVRTPGQTPFYDNIGEVTIQGVEFAGKYYVSRALLLTGSALYQHNEDKDGNEDLTPIANFGAKAGVSYEWRGKATVSVSDIYQDDLACKYDTQVNPSPGSYHLMSAECRFNLGRCTGSSLSDELSLVFRADNVLDEQIWLPNWGMLMGSSIPVDQGRVVYLGAEARWGD